MQISAETWLSEADVRDCTSREMVNKTEKLLFFTGELRKADADIILMIQADMLAYHKPGEPPQLGLRDGSRRY